MHCRIILALMLAAILFAVSPALSQLVPLILDQTIPLPSTSDVWDVMPHPDGYYVWAQAIEPNTEETRIYWGRSDTQSFDSLDLAVGAPQSVGAFYRNDHESCVVLTSRHYELCVLHEYPDVPVDSTYIRIVSLTTAHADTYVWILPPYCYNLGWPIDYEVIYDFHLSALIPIPAPPFSSTRLAAIVSNWNEIQNRDNTGSRFTESNFIPNMLSLTPSTDYSYPGTIVAGWCVGDTVVYIGHDSYHYIGQQWNSFSVLEFVMSHLSGDSLVGDGGFSHTCHWPWNCDIRMIACTFDESFRRPICFGGYAGVIGGITEPDSGLAWTCSINYDFWFATECVPGNSAEEFLCYSRNRAVFDVLDAVDGHSYGVTDTINIATSSARIIGRYDSTFRRLVIRDSTSLKLYRFGEYLATEEHPAPLPSDLNLTAFPNPFNPATIIAFSLPNRGRIELAVYDIMGRKVSVLSNELTVAGKHTISFDGSALPSGIYFARLQTAEISATQKLLLLK